MTSQRIDFMIGEDADFIVIADANRQSQLRTAKEMIAAALKSEAFVLPLPEDGGISGRVVIGELDEEEAQRWVAKAIRPLTVSTQQIVLDAGDFFGHSIPISVGEHDNHAVLEIEPGDYLLTCLVYFTSQISTDLFKRHKFSYLQLFHTTFPERNYPPWLLDEAEYRENETDEEWLESIGDEQIDYELEDRFINVVLQFQKGVTEPSPTAVSKTGRLKFEKRPPSSFPEPLRLLGSEQADSANAIAARMTSAFQDADFESVVAYVSKHLRPSITSFLSDMHDQASAKLTIPSRRYRSDSSTDRGDWISKFRRTGCMVDVSTLQKHAWVGTFGYTLA
ncbi:MAG: hypothetical protein AAGJ83_08815, partial [Planctomycetota bacterium]